MKPDDRLAGAFSLQEWSNKQVLDSLIQRNDQCLSILISAIQGFPDDVRGIYFAVWVIIWHHQAFENIVMCSNEIWAQFRRSLTPQCKRSLVRLAEGSKLDKMELAEKPILHNLFLNVVIDPNVA